MMDANTPKLFRSVQELIEQAQRSIVRNVNTTMVLTYFEIGRIIVEDEQGGTTYAAYGAQTLIKLSQHLSEIFGRGYSANNLQNMRLFFIAYANYQTVSVNSNKEGIQDVLSSKNKGANNYETVSNNFESGTNYATLSRKSDDEPNSATVSRNSSIPTNYATASHNLLTELALSWSHFVELLKIKSADERRFYEIEASRNNWSVRELQRQINSSLYERLALSRDKAGIMKLAQQGQLMEQPTDILKQPLVLEFLGLHEDHRYSENDLETAIINKLEHFMLELGKGFLFEARQRRITLEGDHFWIDLVFYNRLLKCFVLIDLKIGKLTHQDIGQMQMYVNYYDRKIRLADERPTLGIILCKEDNKAVVEFTLPLNNEQIFSNEYQLYLPSKEDLKKQLE